MMRAQEPEALTPLHEVITFYSYKGGTGRTMALANVACLFARQIGSGRVLAIDWDLEAPGLHYYLRSPSGEAADPNVEGVVEYFTRIQEIVGSVSADPDGEEKAAESVLEQLPLDRYRRPTCVSNIDLMPAGRLDETYSSRLAKLDWQLIYEKSPALFRTFARRLAREYDVVLVDSRTGMTDISGICTALLPDKLVVVFTANQQSLTGVERLVLNSVEYRQGSRDLRPLLVYPLPSRIDAERDKLRQLWRFGDAERRIEGFQPQFERIFCSAYAMASSDLTNYCNEVQVQHSPDYSYGEEVAALDAADADRFSIVRSYEALVQWLSSSAAPWESPQKARQRQRLESSLLDEERMLESGTPPDVRSLMSLQEEVVRLALEQRPQHLDTVAAIERLVQTCLKRANDVGRAIEVLDTLTVALSSMRLPAKLKAVDVLLNGARLLKARGQTDEARRLSGVALEEVTASQAVLDEAGLDAVERIAVGLRRGGSFGEARTLLEVVRDRRIQLKNADDPSVLTSMNNLADTLRGQGDLAGARALHEQVLAVRRRMLGEEAPETLTSMNNLAETLRVQGDLTGALALQEQVLAVRRRVLGEEHPATLTSMNNLAGTLRAQGDWTGARMLEEQVLAVRRRVLGEEHPHTLA
ncbi:MAG: tetratricopeptide repeat protein, partial [Burkholderiaceae bacterium]